VERYTRTGAAIRSLGSARAPGQANVSIVGDNRRLVGYYRSLVGDYARIVPGRTPFLPVRALEELETGT